MNEPIPRSIDGRARTVRELMDKAKYAIDFYQREYAWQQRQVRELIDDLTGKFLDFHETGHSRHEVEGYGHYFLGSVVISHKRGQKFVVDGQQRLTTLTLLLIHVHHLQANRESRVPVQDLVYSEKYGDKSFNLDVPDRVEVMQMLLDGRPFDSEGKSESVRNIAARYEDIVDYFPEELTREPLPFFVDWLLENVHLIEIEAYSDDDAYTIFETMNDRGLRLSLPEMLKGYVLANIRREEHQRDVNSTWKRHMLALKDLAEEAEVDFFKDWLRARHADTIRPGHKGAENRDYERIGSEFHRWIRDKRDYLHLVDSDAFVQFVKRDLEFYATQAAAIARAKKSVQEGWESIRFNQDRGFTLQAQALLAPLTPDDSKSVVREKVALVADYLDIWLARRVWNFRTIAYSSVRHTLFTLTKELRNRDLGSLSTFLLEQLDAQPERFAREPRFQLHKQNYWQVRHILARLTHWLNQSCGLPSNFEDLVSAGRSRPFEIEHLWADHPEQFTAWFPQASDFNQTRNRIGGLVLLQRGLNQSLGDSPFEKKRDAYATHSENLLARSLHPLAYENAPAFNRLIKEKDLPFRPYENFGPNEQAERTELYIRLAEWVWSPSRVDRTSDAPPDREPIADLDDMEDEAGPRPERVAARHAFWTRLLEHSRSLSNLHDRISADGSSWLGAKRNGNEWNYVVLQNETRVELYIDRKEASMNKAIYDALLAEREQIESEFGRELRWQRLNDRRACRISASIAGGWVDASGWPRTIDEAVHAMQRLVAVLEPRLEKIMEPRA